VSGSFTLLAERALDLEFHRERRTELLKLLHLDSDAAPAWPISVDFGIPSSCIIRASRASQSHLIVMGLHSHSAVGRILGGDTVRQVIMHGEVPVLAIRPNLTGLPSKVVVAVDFSPASLRVALLARRLIRDNGTMQLVYVEPPRYGGSGVTEGTQLVESMGVEAAFNRLIAALEPPLGMSIVTVTATGSPVSEMRRFCERGQPDLVVAARQYHTKWEKALFESVSLSLTEKAEWSVLIAPRTENQKDTLRL
jgi:nucleotide-binding universal stress UspA family protein